jgi:GNAT superfamily N-acetyltransferase
MEQARRRGIGTRLIDALAEQASHKYDALTLNVHLLPVGEICCSSELTSAPA